MKKTTINRGKRAGKTATAPKVTLPAFGLAEDILGAGSTDPKTQDYLMGMQDARHEPGASASGQALKGEYHLVTFRLDSEEYGVEIGRVQEIIRVGQITAVPNVASFITGVINLRGRIIPVLDLRKRLYLPETGLTKYSRIMVIEFGHKVLGLLVDGVSQVIRVPVSAVEAPPEEIEQSRAFVRGIGKVDSRLIMIMELDKVLAHDVSTVASV